ncbi:hypothetical protein DFH06DRAFT_1347968 [Mycena polygramma]|nr:hypothetical protein DFH06DRAFT_1347968 [Mycena polygramma]
MSRRGRESPFSTQQDAHIESFFPALLAQPSTTVAAWKETTALEILQSPLFKGNLASKSDDDKKGADLVVWKERIKKKFGNRVTADSKKKAKSPSSASGFLTFAPMSAMALFEKENRLLLTAQANEQVSKMQHRMAVCYPSCVEKMWNTLGEDEQTTYQKRADQTPQSVLTNQADFPRAAQEALTTLCRSGHVGKLELMAFWAYREPDGALRHGIIDAHASEDVPDMADTTDWDEKVCGLWQQFAKKYIPTASVAQSTRIPRNAEGIPVFPTVDLQSRTPQDVWNVSAVMTEYLAELWALQWDKAPLPWHKLCQDGIYYDSQKFSPPFQFTAPASLQLPQLYDLAEYFSARSSADPFIFRDHAETVRLLGNAPLPITETPLNMPPNVVKPTEPEPEPEPKSADDLGKPLEDTQTLKRRPGRPPKPRPDASAVPPNATKQAKPTEQSADDLGRIVEDTLIPKKRGRPPKPKPNASVRKGYRDLHNSSRSNPPMPVNHKAKTQPTATSAEAEPSLLPDMHPDHTGSTATTPAVDIKARSEPSVPGEEQGMTPVPVRISTNSLRRGGAQYLYHPPGYVFDFAKYAAQGNTNEVWRAASLKHSESLEGDTKALEGKTVIGPLSKVAMEEEEKEETAEEMGSNLVDQLQFDPAPSLLLSTCCCEQHVFTAILRHRSAMHNLMRAWRLVPRFRDHADPLTPLPASRTGATTLQDFTRKFWDLTVFGSEIEIAGYTLALSGTPSTQLPRNRAWFARSSTPNSSLVNLAGFQEQRVDEEAKDAVQILDCTSKIPLFPPSLAALRCRRQSRAFCAHTQPSS